MWHAWTQQVMDMLNIFVLWEFLGELEGEERDGVGGGARRERDISMRC